MGEAYLQKGEFDDALNQFKLIQDSKDVTVSAKAKLAIAEIFSQKLNASTAMDTYSTIIKNSPEFQRDAFVKMSELHITQEDYGKAIQALKDAQRTPKTFSDYSDAELQFRIGDAFEMMRESNEAVDAYMKIPYLYPKETGWIIKAYLRIARIFEDNEDWDNAKLVYTKIIDYGTDEVKFAQERIEWINANLNTQTY